MEPPAPARAAQGRRSGLVAFEQLYARDYERVVGLAFVLSGSRLAAEDLAQDAFLAAYRAWDAVGDYDDPGAWVRRVVSNRSVSVLRRRVAEAKALTRLSGDRDVVPEIGPAAADVWRAVRRLPRRQAQVIALRYLDDRTLEETARILECSVETVRTHLRRARVTLSHALAVEEGPDER